jgi:hypothetical protein
MRIRRTDRMFGNECEPQDMRWSHRLMTAFLPESPLPDQTAMTLTGETIKRLNDQKKRFRWCEQKAVIRRDFKLIFQIRWLMVRLSFVMDHVYE